MKVIIKEGQCIGCGACEAICEEVFEVDGTAKVKVEEVPKEVEENVKNAAENCPTSAIEIKKEGLSH